MMAKLILITISTGVGVILGFIIASIKTQTKQRRKRERRQRIIDYKKKVIDEICRWDVEHPKLLLMPPAKGKLIFKGGADKMSAGEFKAALTYGFKNTSKSVGKRIKSLTSNVLNKLC